MGTKKLSLKERLQKQRDSLGKGGGNFKFLIFKEGITRMRHLWCGEEREWAVEILGIYVNKEIGFVISPASWGEKCPFKQLYDEMISSKKEADKKFAKKKLYLKKKYACPSVRFKDEAGKEYDTELGEKLALLTNSQYEQMLDLFLDDDSGDFTDPNEGYMLKHKRTGNTQFNTDYNVMTGKPSKVPKQFRGPYNPEEMAKALTPSYKEMKEYLKIYMSIDHDLSDDDNDKKSSGKSSSKSSSKKKNKGRDI